MNRFFAMDTSFYHSLGSYEFDARCEMLAELGYDGTYLTLWSDRAWKDLPALTAVKSRHGLEVAGVYATFDLAKAPEQRPLLESLIAGLEGTKTIELAVTHSGAKGSAADPRVDEELCRELEGLLERASMQDLVLVLYPHITFYIERIERAVELCAKLQHPNVGVAFCGFHWYAADGKELPRRLEEAAPFLRGANLCGSRRNPSGSGMPCSIECLDEGELDNFAVLGSLRQVGYAGWIGLQGYSNGGDVYAKLRRSLQAYRDMNRRLDAHPQWAKLRS